MFNCIKNEVEILKERFGTVNPEELCSLLDIKLLFYALPESMNGFYFELGGKKAIVINTTIEERFKNFFIAHELGHAVLHEKVNYMFLCENTNLVSGKFEKEADLFAAMLLIDEIPQDSDCITENELSLLFGLPGYVIKNWRAVRK